jgi:glyoxylate/hydroxypyruvate reductase
MAREYASGSIRQVTQVTRIAEFWEMKKGALALLVHGGTENWSPARWKTRFDEVCRDRRVLVLPDATYDPAEVHYAAVWKPRPSELAQFPNLRVIFNLGAGVDALMADASLPQVPLVRVAVADLTDRMTEYVVLHVLMHHRQELYLRQSQREKRWAPKYQWAAPAITVGIMGLGTLGANAADVLRRIGFRVVGWSRGAKQVEGVECFHGTAQLEPFLRQTHVLVCLLPLTPDTRHILNRDLFAKLDRESPMGAPVLINAGRGGLQNEADILQSLDDGTLGAASLDVYETEPLPQDSPFWSHPKVVLTPHNAADTDPDEISKYVAQQIERFEAGGALENVVDRKRGY